MIMKRILILLSVLFLVCFCRDVSASPLLMVEAEGIVDGYVGENIGSKIAELRLTDENYRFEVEEDEEITEWFTNIPDGLEVYVLRKGDQRIQVSFEGTPKEESDELMQVKVPDGYIIDLNSDDSIGDLMNVADEKAKYEIKTRVPSAEYEKEAIVSGYVGEQLIPQRVYIRLHHTTAEASMMHHLFETHNGLIPEVIEILPENVIVVEYTGIPLEEDDSLIHTVLLDEDLKCDQDLIVTDREDVRFAIRKKTIVIPDVPKIEIPEEHVIPITGIE